MSLSFTIMFHPMTTTSIGLPEIDGGKGFKIFRTMFTLPLRCCLSWMVPINTRWSTLQETFNMVLRMATRCPERKLTNFAILMRRKRSEEHTSELQSQFHLLF